MKRLTSVAAVMMGMCIRTCCMCIAFYVLISELFSVSGAKRAAA